MARSRLFNITRTVVYQIFKWHNVILEKAFRHLVTAPYDYVSTWDIPLIEPFRRYLYQNPDAVEQLKAGMDKESSDTIEIGLKRLLSFPSMDYVTLYRCNHEMYLTPQEKADRSQYRASIAQYQQQYGKGFAPFGIPEFFYHHGLIHLDQKVKDYIKGGTFIDCGTFNGASIAIMSGYGPTKVYGIEPNPSNLANAVRNLNAMTTPPPFEIIPAGVSDTEGTVGFECDNGVGRISDSEFKVTIRRIDSICAEKEIKNVKWLKADIEGAAYLMIKGAEETIKRDRPLLTIGVYHSPDEFFEIRKLIDSWNLNYHFMMRRCDCQGIAPFDEITLIGFPKELAPAAT